MADPAVVDVEDAGRFEVRVDGELAGFADYSRRGSALAFTHTVVDPAFEGRGLGSLLVRGALEAARAQGAAVLPFCPFVRSWLERHPDQLDLVPTQERERFGLPTAS